jgi:hypothetical protein
LSFGRDFSVSVERQSGELAPPHGLASLDSKAAHYYTATQKTLLCVTAKFADQQTRRVCGMSAVPPIAPEFVHCTKLIAPDESTRSRTRRDARSRRKLLTVMSACPASLIVPA